MWHIPTAFAYHESQARDSSTVRPDPPLGTFGEKLRRQREQRGMALDAISNSTKISARMLRALEEEHFEQLPGGVFNKGFVRAYARQVGLDEEETVADYLAAVQASQIQDQTTVPDIRSPGARTDRVVTPASHATPDGNNGKKERRRNDRRKFTRREGDLGKGEKPLGENRGSEQLRILPEAPADSAAVMQLHSVPWGKLAAVLLLITLALAAWNFRRRVPSVASHSASSSKQPAVAQTPSAASQPAERAASPTNSPPVKPAAVTIPSSSIPETNTADTDNDLPEAKKATSAASATTAPAITVLIRATETSWVSIMADGKPVAEETLIAPAQTSVRAGHEAVVKVGNAAGVSFVVNGKEIPAQGSQGEVKTCYISAQGVRCPSQPETTASQTKN